MRKWCTTLFFVVFLATVSGSNLWAQQVTFYDLGHYPGGTWAEPWGINKAGVLAGFGDIARGRGAKGFTHAIGVPLYGPNAGQWFDIGTLGGETTDDKMMCMAIADTGMIVGHSPIAGNVIIHAFVWTSETGMADLGTLENLGHNYSLAWGTNRSGTLIAGYSGNGIDVAETVPVVWMPKVVWDSDQWKTTWQIHQLNITGFDGFGYWKALVPNDHGQIIGMAIGADGTSIGVLWSPISGGKDWKIQQLPLAPGYSGVWPLDINNNGEIVGDVLIGDTVTEAWSAEFPAYWKPTDRSGSQFNVTILPTLGGDLSGLGDGEAINDVGDIVGGSTDANGNYYATAWSTKDPNFAPKLLPSPRHSGSWSWAAKVNNNGVVAGSYGYASVPENTAAWTLR
jgi:probable HAF family extracellular repeat protein